MRPLHFPIDVPFNFLIETCCLLFSIVYLRKERRNYWHSLIWFMLAICLFEGTGWLIRITGGNNHWLYNFEMLLEVGFTGWLLNKIYQPIFNGKSWIISGFIIFLITYVVETIIRVKNSQYGIYNNISNIESAILFIIASGYYYYLLLKDEAYINLLRHPPFWLISGLFIFFFGSTVASTFFKELLSIHITKGIPIRFFVFIMLNGILYGCWIYAFKCKYRQTI